MSRSEWRDATKAKDNGLSCSARHLALIIADFWRHDEDDPVLWCANDVAAEDMNVSERTVARARRELIDGGWLTEVSRASGHMAARYSPTINQGCHIVTPEVTGWQPRGDILSAESIRTPNGTPHEGIAPRREGPNSVRPTDRGPVSGRARARDKKAFRAGNHAKNHDSAYQQMLNQGIRFPAKFLDHIDQPDGYLGSHVWDTDPEEPTWHPSEEPPRDAWG